MSLLERQLKAMKAETARTEPPAAPEEAPPGSLVPALIPTKPDAKPATPRTAAREEMIHDIRVRMQREIINAFDTLLDGTSTDTRGKV